MEHSILLIKLPPEFSSSARTGFGGVVISSLISLNHIIDIFDQRFEAFYSLYWR